MAGQGGGISGLEEIDRDMRKFSTNVMKAIQKALDDTMQDDLLRTRLARHIQTDVYGEYAPKVYQRRSKNPEMGRPLIDVENQSYTTQQTLDGPLCASQSFAYAPTGKHAVKKWSDVHGDTLIGRIEHQSPPYRWGGPDDRPFWGNFVDDVLDHDLGNWFLFNLISALATSGNPDDSLDIDFEGGAVVREEEDGQYDTGGTTRGGGSAYEQMGFSDLL